MSSKIVDTKLWDELHNRIVTNKGGWRIGEAVYNHGYDMMNDLVGSHSYFQVLVLNVTGEVPSEKLSKWLEAGFICLSWPDPRIWCNQIGALAGTTRSSCPSAIAGGILAADSRMYGSGTMKACLDFIYMARKQQSSGKSVKDIVEDELKARSKVLKSRPVIVGYSRPIASGDERVTAMQRVGKELKFPVGLHEQLAKEIHLYLNENHNEGFNVAGYMAAVLADQGLSSVNAERLFFKLGPIWRTCMLCRLRRQIGTKLSALNLRRY